MKQSKSIIIFSAWFIVAVAVVYVHFAQNVTSVPLKKPFLYFPFEIEGWKDREKSNSDYLISALGADDVLVREYENKEGEKLELYFSYFNFTNKGKAPHAPQLCWVGSGWAFKDLGVEVIQPACAGCPAVAIKKILAEKKDASVILFYCYRANREYVADFTRFRGLIVRDSLVKRKNSAFTLQLSSPADKYSVQAKAQVMRDFLTQVFSILEKDFLP